MPFSGLFLKKIDHVWWDHGIGAMRNADGFFRKWLAPRVDAAAEAAAEDPNGGALRAACPYSVAFHFEARFCMCVELKGWGSGGTGCSSTGTDAVFP